MNDKSQIIANFIAQHRSDFESVLCDDSIQWARESVFAAQALENNDFLQRMAQNSPQSARNAIINIASIGISLNPASKHAYLVPRSGKVCLDVSYMGLLHLAQTTGAIKWGQCKLVHADDSYESTGVATQPVHKYSAFKNRGDIVGGYCVVKTVDGDFLTHEMSIEDIINIANRSESYKKNKGPWTTDFKEMAKKTIVKQASKYWPSVPRLNQAVEYMNTEGGEGIDFEKESNPSHQTISDEQINHLVEKYPYEQYKEKWDILARAYRFSSQSGEIHLGKIPSKDLNTIIAELDK